MTEARVADPQLPVMMEKTGEEARKSMDIDSIVSEMVSTKADRRSMDPSSASSTCSKRIESETMLVRDSKFWRGACGIRIIQINLQNAKTTSTNLLLHLVVKPVNLI